MLCQPKAHALVALLAALALAVPAHALDEGRLEPQWFGGELEFRAADEIDYLWVAPGFSLAGKKVRFVPFPAEPELLGADAGKRNAKDRLLARQMAAVLHDVFADAFGRAYGGRLTVVEADEDVRVEGRIVDCSTGAVAAKMLVGFGAGAGNTTLDLKFLDAASGAVQMAIHHRSVSGTSWSTTDSKLVNWAEEMAEEGAEKGFEKLYAKGKRVRD